MKNFIRFLTILFSVIALSALLAHLFELRVKINMPRDNYLVVQSIYRGWIFLGIFEIGAILLSVIWMFRDRHDKNAFPFLLAAVICFISSFILFFIFTFPANQATQNWTQLPADWQQLRLRWEYSHAVRAVINLAGLCLLIVALLKMKNLINPKRFDTEKKIKWTRPQ